MIHSSVSSISLLPIEYSIWDRSKVCSLEVKVCLQWVESCRRHSSHSCAECLHCEHCHSPCCLNTRTCPAPLHQFHRSSWISPELVRQTQLISRTPPAARIARLSLAECRCASSPEVCRTLALHTVSLVTTWKFHHTPVVLRWWLG